MMVNQTNIAKRKDGSPINVVNMKKALKSWDFKAFFNHKAPKGAAGIFCDHVSDCRRKFGQRYF